MIIFDLDHPLVLDGTYDQEGYKPGERARIAKARARQQQLKATMAKKRASKADKKPDTRKKKPKQQELIEDRVIKPIEKLAVEYREIMDERMDLTAREHALKLGLLKLLHKFGKTEYRRGGLVIRLVAGEEKVSVRVAKEGEDDDELEDTEPEAEPDEDEVEGEPVIPPADELPRA